MITLELAKIRYFEVISTSYQLKFNPDFNNENANELETFDLADIESDFTFEISDHPVSVFEFLAEAFEGIESFDVSP